MSIGVKDTVKPKKKSLAFTQKFTFGKFQITICAAAKAAEWRFIWISSPRG